MNIGMKCTLNIQRPLSSIAGRGLLQERLMKSAFSYTSAELVVSLFLAFSVISFIAKWRPNRMRPVQYSLVMLALLLYFTEVISVSTLVGTIIIVFSFPPLIRLLFR